MLDARRWMLDAGDKSLCSLIFLAFPLRLCVRLSFLLALQFCCDRLALGLAGRIFACIKSGARSVVRRWLAP